MEIIENMFKNINGEKAIQAAWGTNIQRRKYLKTCMEDMVLLMEKYNVSWYKAGKVSKEGHPHHSLYLKSNSVLEPFDVKDYITNF